MYIFHSVTVRAELGETDAGMLAGRGGSRVHLRCRPERDSPSSQEKTAAEKQNEQNERRTRSDRQKASHQRVSGRSGRFAQHFTDPKRYKGLNFNSLNQSAKIVWKWAIFWIKGLACDDETANIMMK